MSTDAVGLERRAIELATLGNFGTDALEVNRELTVVAPGAKGDALQYIAGLKLDGKAHERVWLDWKQLQRGPSLDFTLTAQANPTGWGTSPSALPASPCAAAAE